MEENKGKDIYVCVKKCYFQDKLYDPSSHKKEDRLIIVPHGQKVECPHFKLMGANSQEVKEPADVRTVPKPRPMSQNTQIVSKESRLKLIMKAIGELDEEKDYWHGKPKVYAIEDNLDMTITKEERDIAFERVQKEKEEG